MLYPLSPRLLLVIVLLFTLTACQTLPNPKSDGDRPQWRSDSDVFAASLKQVSALNTWHYSAKVGVTTPRGKEQANLVWRFADQASNVRLFGPLGAGAVRIEFDDYGVVLSDSKGVLHRGDSAEELLTRIVGWPIPIDALSYWLFVLPNPDVSYRYQLNADGDVSVLEQLGWSIHYSAYRPYQDGRRLPRKIVATKQLENRHQVVVKLITKSWKWP
jgi:outer membrane lipoprotein LolB